MTEEEVKLKNHKGLEMTNWPHRIPLILIHVPILLKQMTLNTQKVTVFLAFGLRTHTQGLSSHYVCYRVCRMWKRCDPSFRGV